MKEVKRTRTIEEIVGYEVEGGKVFRTKEEAEKYEQTAEYACYEQFKTLMTKVPFRECEIFEHFGYGSEEFMYTVIEMKNKNDLKIALMYQRLRDKSCGEKFTADMIGKRILVALGYDGDYPQCYPVGTYADLLDKFVKDVMPYFKEKEEV